MDIEYPCGKDVVEAVLPHRDPFCWVSRIVACEPGVEVTAELDVRTRSWRCSRGISRGIPFCRASSSWSARAGGIVLHPRRARSRGFYRLPHRHRRREVPPPGGAGRDAHAERAHREVLVASVRRRGGGERRRPAVRVGRIQSRYVLQSLRDIYDLFDRAVETILEPVRERLLSIGDFGSCCRKQDGALLSDSSS